MAEETIVLAPADTEIEVILLVAEKRKVIFSNTRFIGVFCPCDAYAMRSMCSCVVALHFILHDAVLPALCGARRFRLRVLLRIEINLAEFMA